MSGPAIRLPTPIAIHVLALASLTTVTNGVAIAAGRNGSSAVIAMAVTTLVAASLEPVVARRAGRLEGIDAATLAGAHRVHMWACGLAAAVATICGLMAAF